MTDSTYMAEDARDLPYRFANSPITNEWFIIAIGHGFNVLGFFENDPAFYRFLLEGMRAYDTKKGGVLKQVSDILKEQQDGGG